MSKKVSGFDTSRRIPITLSNYEYTATEDMWVIVYGFCTKNTIYSAIVFIDNDVIAQSIFGGAVPLFFPLFKGQKVLVNEYTGYAAILGYPFR